MLTKEQLDYIAASAETVNEQQLLAHIREQDATLAALLAKMRACVARGTGANVVEIERWIESVKEK